MVTCPRDGLQGSAIVDSMYGPENAGPATRMLSCSPRDAVGEAVVATEEFCHDRGLNPWQTYVWSWTCSNWVNLHHSPPQLPEWIADSRRYGSQIGKVLVTLMPWHYLGSLGSLPSLRELWQAVWLAGSRTTSPWHGFCNVAFGSSASAMELPSTLSTMATIGSAAINKPTQRTNCRQAQLRVRSPKPYTP
ncbi:unnamed protein product [Symbiodinium sp. KB8]|nr:unnamed protein product [Symbiodinium sp. KB8]